MLLVRLSDGLRIGRRAIGQEPGRPAVVEPGLDRDPDRSPSVRRQTSDWVGITRLLRQQGPPSGAPKNAGQETYSGLPCVDGTRALAVNCMLVEKPKIAYLRGYFLCRSETDYIVHVGREFELGLFTSHYSRFNLSGSPIPVERLPAAEDIYRFLPSRLIRYPQALIGKMLGLDGIFFGLDKRLAEFDIVHTAESLFYFSYQAARLKRKLGYRLIVLQDEVYPFQRDNSRLVRHMRRTVHAAADLFLARTERARDALLLEGVDETRIRVVPHGVDTQMFRPMPPDPEYRKRFGAAPGQPVVLFIGRLSWEKGIFTLAQAVRLMQPWSERTGVHPKFVVIGQGSERDRLVRTLHRLQVSDRVTLIPNVPFADVPRALSACDIFVLPSIASRAVSEQFGHVLLQAMACGRPVVATDCGPMTEVVGDAALSVPQNDAHSLARALERLLERQDLRAELTAAGLQRVKERFSAELVAGQIADLYRAVLAL